MLAQKKAKPDFPNFSAEDLYKVNRDIYNLSLKYHDFATAKYALYNLLHLKPERIELKDTLAYLYYNSSDYVQVVLLGNEILQSHPDNAGILELVAVSQQNLGMIRDALASFEKLYTLTKSIYHQYNIASLQYMLKRFGECSETLNAIISSGDDTGMVSITDQQGESQNVPIRAAAFNMRGVVALELNKPDIAIQNFEKAIELFPQFQLANNNMERAK